MRSSNSPARTDNAAAPNNPPRSTTSSSGAGRSPAADPVSNTATNRSANQTSSSPPPPVESTEGTAPAVVTEQDVPQNPGVVSTGRSEEPESAAQSGSSRRRTERLPVRDLPNPAPPEPNLFQEIRRAPVVAPWAVDSNSVAPGQYAVIYMSENRVLKVDGDAKELIHRKPDKQIANASEVTAAMKESGRKLVEGIEALRTDPVLREAIPETWVRPSGVVEQERRHGALFEQLNTREAKARAEAEMDALIERAHLVYETQKAQAAKIDPELAKRLSEQRVDGNKDRNFLFDASGKISWVDPTIFIDPLWFLAAS